VRPDSYEATRPFLYWLTAEDLSDPLAQMDQVWFLHAYKHEAMV